MEKLKVLDLFSGIGGFSLGLEQTGYFETVGFCEIESYCQAVLKKHWPDVPIYEDVTKITNMETNIDVLCGGFPCQDISIAGKGAGINGEKSGLWKEYHRLINEIRPKYAIVENVSALLGRGLGTVLADLAEIGYDATWTTLDTQYFGLPQRRRRVYIVAVRDGIPDNMDIFNIRERNNPAFAKELEHFKESRPWHFEEREGIRDSFAYFTRNRSDQFGENGVSSALLKRDYKQFTDLVVCGDDVRRVTPQERLRLQGFPDTWFDGCGLTNEQQFRCNGMSVPVVKHIGECIYESFRL